jgi:hypothetical protein
LPGRHGIALRLGLEPRHDAGSDIVIEGEDGDGGLADREGRGRDDGRQKPFKPLCRYRQLGKDAGATRIDRGADMVRKAPRKAGRSRAVRRG